MFNLLDSTLTKFDLTKFDLIKTVCSTYQTRLIIFKLNYTLTYQTQTQLNLIQHFKPDSLNSNLIKSELLAFEHDKIYISKSFYC